MQAGEEAGKRAAAPGSANLHARVMELLFVTGDAVVLNVAQIATILGVDPAAVAAELSTNRFVQYNATKQTVSLLKERPKSERTAKAKGKAGSGHARDPAATAAVVVSSTDDDDEEAVVEDDENREYTPRAQPSGQRRHQPTAAHEIGPQGGPAGSKGGDPMPSLMPLGSSARSPGAKDSHAAAGGRLQHQSWGRPSSSSAGLRRRKAAVSRIGSLNPPSHDPQAMGFPGASAAAAGPRRSGSDEMAYAGSTAPMIPLLSGRVGYVCVAEEFKLSEMQAFYSSLGYFTKFDLGVLHVRLPERDGSFPKTSTDKLQDDQPHASASPSAVAAADDFSSPTTTTYIRQRRSNFDLFLFEYGAVVWWGSDQRFFKLVETDFLLPDSEAERFMVNRYSTQLVTENYPVWCSYSLVKKEFLVVDEDFKKKLRFDHFLIPFGRLGEDASLCGTTMLCCSHALAQSAKIDYLELKVQELTEACAPLPRELRLKGRAKITERRLLQLRGEVLSYRLTLNSGSDLLDEPDFFWENGYLKPIFEATKEAFGVDDRVEALDNKLDASNEILSMLADEFSQRHGARLEWIVIWLVFVEVIIGVLELAVDFKPWIYRT